MSAFGGIASFAEGTPWMGALNWVAALMGISTTFPSFISNPFIWDSVKLLILGSVIETGRRLFRWIMGRFKFRYFISAEFKPGNPTYEWLVTYLMKEKVWSKPRDFVVEIKSSQRKWKVETGPEHSDVDYVPVYGTTQFFRWNGYLLEITQPMQGGVAFMDEPVAKPYGHRPGSLFLTIYTLDASVLFSFVEECRKKYTETTKPHVIVHAIGSRRGYSDPGDPGSVKRKHRRPLDSLLLDGDTIGSLLADAREFLEIEDWYINAGIPHRRGYLLHGPPGTGKTSTVYTIAGELGLEIYSLSLSSPGMNDDTLFQQVSSLPPRGLLLIEDIDCAFLSREDQDRDLNTAYPLTPGWPRLNSFPRSQITLSGLLNILDGIGSEEGKIFFATTNHIDRLDPALLRPGRIDRKIEYKLASQKQAHALFTRFFPATRFADASNLKLGKHFEVQYAQNADELADAFARSIPENEFSVAELQGYLLDWKSKPLDAVSRVDTWVESERALKREKETRERERKERAAAEKVQEQIQVNSAVIAGIGTAMAHGQISAPPIPHPDSTPEPTLLNDSPPKVDSGSVSPAISEAGDRDISLHLGSPITDAVEVAQ